MKCAICLRGCMDRIKSGHYHDKPPNEIYNNNNEYINYFSVYNSIIKHIIETNKDFSFDIFIQSWNPDLEISLNNLYKPKAFLYENQLLYENIIKKNIIHNYGYTAQQLGIVKSINLMIEYSKMNNIIYDYVVVYRPDVILYKDLYLYNYNKDKIYVNDSINEDFHFIMNFNNAIDFSNLFGKKLSFLNYVKNYMKINLTPDDIKCGLHQEVLRKLKLCAIDKHNIPKENFYKYGLTDKEIELLTHK